MLGSRWGIEDVPGRVPGPCQPARARRWLSHARHRLQVGLADDFIGYLIPPWAYIGEAGAISTTDGPRLQHRRRLDGLGRPPPQARDRGRRARRPPGSWPPTWPTLSWTPRPSPAAEVVPGRFVLADGTLSRSPIGRGRRAAGRRIHGHRRLHRLRRRRQAAPDILTRGLARPAGAEAARCAGASSTSTSSPAFHTGGRATAPAQRPGCDAPRHPHADPDRSTPTVTPPSLRRSRRAEAARDPARGCAATATACASAAARSTAAARGCGASVVVLHGHRLRAKGTSRWHLTRRVRRARRVTVIATDRAGNRTRRRAKVRRRMNVAVIGAGSWGTTVAHLAAHRTPTVLWARREELARAIADDHVNRDYLPDHELCAGPATRPATWPRRSTAPTRCSSASRRTASARRWARWPTTSPTACPVVSLTKGFEQSTHKRMTELIAEELPGRPAGVLAGPNLAKEILDGYAAAAVIAMTDDGCAREIQGDHPAAAVPRLRGPTTSSASRSPARSRTSSRSPPAWPRGSARATTRAP